jgi:RNA 2',3'-cyclic 3'-phosphodiesterase
MGSVTRTFIAIDLGESVRLELASIIRKMAKELPVIRWVDPAGIHLTLAFLGYLTDERLVEAMQAAETAAHQVSPFVCRLSHLGAFDSLLHPRVIWMGINEPSGSLQQLHRALNWELEQRKFPVETRPFSPHLTLARIKVSPGPDQLERLRQLLVETKITASSPAHRVDRLCVMKSELLRSGARYTHLGNYLLGGERG